MCIRMSITPSQPCDNDQDDMKNRRIDGQVSICISKASWQVGLAEGGPQNHHSHWGGNIERRRIGSGQRANHRGQEMLVSPHFHTTISCL